MASIFSDIMNLLTLIRTELSDLATGVNVSINASVIFVTLDFAILLSSPYI